MTPDWSASPEAVPYAELGDPQTLNLYVYGRNNPVTDVDTDGHTPLDWIWEQSGYMQQEVGFGFHLWAGAAKGKTGRAIAQGPGAIPLVVPGAPSLLAPGSEVTVTAATALDPATLLAVDAVLLHYDVLQFRQLGEAYGWWNAPVVLPPPVTYSKGGKQRIRQTEFEGMPDEEVDRIARDKSLPKDYREKAQQEQKARGRRNVQKRRP